MLRKLVLFGSRCRSLGAIVCLLAGLALLGLPAVSTARGVTITEYPVPTSKWPCLDHGWP
jgi:hypothetical protein